MNKEFIDEVITELSYRVGAPDLKDNNHLIILRTIFEEKGLSYELIEKTMQNLRTPVKKNPAGINPKGFSVDFDGAHSIQAEPELYINPHQPQDHADQDEWPQDDRDPDERDTPANESINELDYMDADVEDEDDINEDDLVKKKESGNVYPVQSFDAGKGQVLVKKDASPEDIEKSKSGKSTKDKPKKIGIKLGAGDDTGPEKPGIYSQKSEISKGLFSDEIKNINGVDVRQMVDESGNVIDVSTSEGRKKGIDILDKRIKSHGDKIKNATLLLSDKKTLAQFKKESGESGTLIMKWLGEVGELQVYKDFLGLGKQAYMLTDSAPKNDMVVLTDSGKEREIDMSYISIKTVKGGKQENGLGANCKSEYEKFFKKAPIKNINIDVGGESVSVSADTLAASTMNVRSEFLNVFSEAAGVCYDGVKFNKEDSDSYLPGYKKYLKKDKNTGNLVFDKDAQFSKFKKVSKDDVEKIFNSPGIDKRFKTLGESKASSSEAKKIKTHFKQELLNRIDKSGGKFSLYDMEQWEIDNIGRAFDETKTSIVATSDTGVAYFHEGSPELDVNIVPAESVNVEYKTLQTKISDIKDSKERADNLVKLTGLRQAVRKVGGSKKKKICQSKLDGIDNTKPMIKSDKHRLSIDEYSKKYLDNK